MGLPITLVPYEAARDVTLTSHDVDRIARSGPVASWVADRTRGWFDFWQNEIGRGGVYPFDLLAAQYVLAPELFDCASASARVGKDKRLWNFWFHDPDAMLVENPGGAGPAPDAEIVYCPRSSPNLHQRLLDALLATQHEGLGEPRAWGACRQPPVRPREALPRSRDKPALQLA